MPIDYVAPVTTLLSAATAAGAGDFTRPGGLKRTFQATITGSFTASINIEGSNDGVGWVVIAAIEVDGSVAATVSNGFVTDSPWWLTRANVTAISGGSVKVTMGCRSDS